MFKFRPDSPQCGCSFASPSFKGTELSPLPHPHTIFQMSGVVRIFFPSSLAPPPHRYQRSHTFDLVPPGSSWITVRNCETLWSPPITTQPEWTVHLSRSKLQVKSSQDFTQQSSLVPPSSSFVWSKIYPESQATCRWWAPVSRHKKHCYMEFIRIRWSQKASAKHWWIFADLFLDLLLQIPQLPPSPNRLGLHAEGHTALLIAASSGIHPRRMWWPGTGDMAATSAAWRRGENHLWYPYLPGKQIDMKALVNEA